MPARLAEALPALFLEDAQLRAAGFSIDHADDSRISDIRRAGHDVPGVLLDEQYLVERKRRSGLDRRAVDLDDASRGDFELSASSLNNGVHVRYL
jgi:hypothetical protein